MKENEIYSDLLIQKTKINLEKHFFKVHLVHNKEEAVNILKKIINKNSVFGFGGSRTLEEIGFFNEFTVKDYPNMLDRNNQALTPESKQALQKNALTADFFLCSANALSATGELVLIDKWGNRTGAMTYGPQNRIFVIGRNKITLTLEEAINRSQNKAAVMNNIRFDTKNPCTKTGYCQNCESENRICGVTTLVHRSLPVGSVIVILVNEDLGF